MRELRLKYIISMVSDIKSRAKDDAQALTMAQEAVQKALGRTELQIGGVERALLAMGRQGSRTAAQQADYLARLALRWMEVKRAAEGAAKAMQTAASIGAGATAGAYAADRMTRAPQTYERSLANLANTAYNDQGLAGRQAGMQVLNASITAGLRVGGGSRDDALQALQSLIGSGTVPREKAMAMLPMILRAATAGDSSATSLAGLAVAGLQSGVDVSQISDLFNMAIVAGQEGGVEIRDMANRLPEAMAMGAGLGLTGLEGARRIMASMQASLTTAGSKDKATNNVVNLLGKLNAPDTVGNIRKELGTNLTDELVSQRANGVNALDAFVGIVDKVMKKDEKYTSLKQRLAAGGSTPEGREAQEAMLSLMQGSAIGRVIQDRESQLALIAELAKRDFVGRVMEQTRLRTGEEAMSFGLLRETSDFKRQQVANQAAEAAQTAFQKAAPAINAVYDGATELSREFPLLSAGVVGATAMLTVFSAALGASGLMQLLTGRGGAAASSVLARVLSGVAAPVTIGAAALAAGHPAAAAGLGSAGTVAGGMLGMFKRFPGVVAASELFGTSDSDLAVLRAAEARRDAFRTAPDPLSMIWGQDPGRDFASLSDPRSGFAAAMAGSKVELGQGKIDVSVRVQDDRATASASFADMAQVRLQGGSTNPAGY